MNQLQEIINEARLIQSDKIYCDLMDNGMNPGTAYYYAKEWKFDMAEDLEKNPPEPPIEGNDYEWDWDVIYDSYGISL